MSTGILRPTDVPATARQQRETFGDPVFDSNGLFVGPKETPGSTAVTSQTFIQGPNHDAPLLQVSMYSEPEHCLDLTTLDTPNRLFALALTTLKPSSPDHATTPYSEVFNWSTIFTELQRLASAESFHFPRTEFYVIEFRSKLKPEENIDVDWLFKLDKESHREATESGGLLKYWFGVPDTERRNLATCFWRSKDDALAGGKGPWHKQARGIISAMYEGIRVSGLRLVVDENVEGWKFEPISFK